MKSYREKEVSFFGWKEANCGTLNVGQCDAVGLDASLDARAGAIQRV